MICSKGPRFILVLAGMLFLPGFLFNKPKIRTYHTPPVLIDVPQVLWAGLLPAYSKKARPDAVVTKEDYLAEQLAFIRFNGRDGHTLTEADYQNKINENHKKYLNRIKNIFEVYDENKDGTATLEEATHSTYEHLKCITFYIHKDGDSMCSTTPEFKEKQKQARIDFFQAHDQDKDGLVVVSDFSYIDNQTREKIEAQYAKILEYLRLDQNKDTILTDEELKLMAESVFEMLDKDHDSVLSQEEQSVLMTKEKSAYDLHRLMRPRSYCGYTAQDQRECVKGYESAALSPEPKMNKQ